MKSGIEREVGQLRASVVSFHVRPFGRPAASGACQALYTFSALADAEVGFRAARGWFYHLTAAEIAESEASSGQLCDRTWRFYSVRWFIPTGRDHADAAIFNHYVTAIRSSFGR